VTAATPAARTAAARLARWPVFLALAVVHLLVLPLVVEAHEHDVIVVAAGAAYLALAALDRFVPRPQSDRAARGRRAGDRRIRL
jgi:hypothetical protein